MSEEHDSPEAAEARRLRAQRGLAALLKRVVILHGAEIVGFTVWWAAIQRPGLIGWTLTGAPHGPLHAATHDSTHAAL